MITVNKKIIVFDVCGTITKTNNTFHFINFVLKKENKVRYLLFKLFVLLNFIAVKTTSRRMGNMSSVLFRKKSIWLLNGLCVDRVNDLAKNYTTTIINKNLLNQSILNIIENNRADKEIIIVSASIDPPIKILAELLQIKQFYSSILETENNKYTGRLRRDLLGKKNELMPELSKKFGMEGSAIYSDNLDDLFFMENFSESYAVVNEYYKKKYWKNEGYEKNIFVIDEKKIINNDTSSITIKNVGYTYIPTFYYILSRFNSYKIGFFLKELVPTVLAIYLFSKTSLWETTLVMTMSFIGFYSVYEIGGLFNDLEAGKEEKGNPTHRIDNDVKINKFAFVVLRIIFVFFLFLIFKINGYQSGIYFLSLLACLLIYSIHTKIKNDLRLITFTLLKIFRSACPLLIFFYRMDIITITAIIITIILMNLPLKLLSYTNKRNGIDLNTNFYKFYVINTVLMVFLGIIICVLFKNLIVLYISLYFSLVGVLGMIKKIYEIN